MREVSVPFCGVVGGLASGECLFEEVGEGGGEGEALDALCAPLGADLIAGDAPDFFGVGLEEGEVELAAEAVDEEVFEGLLVAAGKDDGREGS